MKRVGKVPSDNVSENIGRSSFGVTEANDLRNIAITNSNKASGVHIKHNKSLSSTIFNPADPDTKTMTATISVTQIVPG